MAFTFELRDFLVAKFHASDVRCSPQKQIASIFSETPLGLHAVESVGNSFRVTLNWANRWNAKQILRSSRR
jgi:hypothetical protein